MSPYWTRCPFRGIVRTISRPTARAQLRPLTDRSDPNSIEHVTFGDFFVDSSMCPPVREERRAVLEASPRNPELRTIVARVVAADVHKWLRSEILGPQDVLVDLPPSSNAHAVSTRGPCRRPTSLERSIVRRGSPVRSESRHLRGPSQRRHVRLSALDAYSVFLVAKTQVVRTAQRAVLWDRGRRLGGRRLLRGCVSI